jgi:hypothetical protein
MQIPYSLATKESVLVDKLQFVCVYVHVCVEGRGQWMKTGINGEQGIEN